jgi:hypothetical protein
VLSGPCGPRGRIVGTRLFGIGRDEWRGGGSSRALLAGRSGLGRELRDALAHRKQKGPHRQRPCNNRSIPSCTIRSNGARYHAAQYSNAKGAARWPRQEETTRMVGWCSVVWCGGCTVCGVEAERCEVDRCNGLRHLRPAHTVTHARAHAHACTQRHSVLPCGIHHSARQHSSTPISACYKHSTACSGVGKRNKWHD